MNILVLRYRNVGLAHISADDMDAVNTAAIRLDPRSIQLTEGSMTVVLRCAAERAIAEVTFSGHKPLVLGARAGQPSTTMAW